MKCGMSDFGLDVWDLKCETSLTSEMLAHVLQHVCMCVCIYMYARADMT